MVRSSSQSVAGQAGLETMEPVMSMWRPGSHECEPVSSQAIPLRYSIGQEHPEINACPSHEGWVGHQSDVRGSQHASQFLWALLTSALALALVMPGAGYAQERTSADAPTSPGPSQAAPIGPPAPEGPKQVLNWETGAGRSYIIPAVELIGYLLLLNQFDRHFVEPKDIYRTGTESFWKNLTDSKWVVDQRPVRHEPVPASVRGIHLLRIRAIGRPQLLGIVRVCDRRQLSLGDWGARPGRPPSMTRSRPLSAAVSWANRSSGWPAYCSRATAARPGSGESWAQRWSRRPPASTVSSSATGSTPCSRATHPAISTRFQLGAGLNTHLTGPATSSFKQNQAIADFQLAYGLPGKPGYSYTRPFDYFNFEFTASTANTFENIITRGLLFGAPYAAGDSYRGVWGLYGSYDYISPQVFRVSSSALNLGTTAQWWLSRTVALQGTALGGVGYGAAGTINGSW